MCGDGKQCQSTNYYDQVISRGHENLCLPSAEDTDVTELYQDHLTRSHDPPTEEPHDKKASCDPIIEESVVSHDSVTSHDYSLVSHDMDSLLTSLTLFDVTHLGRLGTAVSMGTSSVFVAIVIINYIISQLTLMMLPWILVIIVILFKGKVQ